MADQFEEEEKDGAGQFLLGKLLGGLLGLFIVGFGIQTWLFVNVFMPSDESFMKILTTFSFDGMGFVYFLLRNFFRFRATRSRYCVNAMLVFCLVASGACTALYVYLGAAHFNWSLIPGWVLLACYALSTVAILAEVYMLYYIHDLETAAKKAGKRPQPPRKRNPGFEALTPEEERIRTAVLSQMLQPTRSEIQQAIEGTYHGTRESTPVQEHPYIDEVRQEIKRELARDSTPVLSNADDYLSLLDKAVQFGQISEEKAQPLRDMIRGQTRPLAQAPSSQNGHQNGNTGQK